jgi:hypothetical protein
MKTPNKRLQPTLGNPRAAEARRYANENMRLRLVISALATACCVSGCREAPNEFKDPLTGELHWFQCVTKESRPSGVPDLQKSDVYGCYGVDVRVPAGFHSDSSRKASNRGLNPYGGLQIDVPRQLIGDEEVPRTPPAYELVRVVLKPIHEGTPFFNGAYESLDAEYPSQTQVFLTSLRGFWKVQDTQAESHGFRVFETPREEQQPNHGKRVYAPTLAHPDLFAECNLTTLDNRGRNWAPTCRVFSTYGSLFELEYRILHADIERVRSFDRTFKRLLNAWIA